MQPATIKQKNYAHNIAACLRIPLPTEESISAFGTFIAQNTEKYYKKRKILSKQKKTTSVSSESSSVSNKTGNYVIEEVDTRIRLQRVRNRLSKTPLQTPKDLIAFMKREMKSLDTEQLIVINLDPQKRPINMQTIAIGALANAAVSGQDVYKSAILSHASGILLFRNHVGENKAKPTKEETTFTKQMKEAGKSVGIELLDHIIIAGDKYYSYQESNHNIFPQQAVAV
ncbi:MAG: JAB domain-containing protein [Blautia obeum]|nr:JAB domain-containing protein [Blautia obeum]